MSTLTTPHGTALFVEERGTTDALAPEGALPTAEHPALAIGFLGAERSDDAVIWGPVLLDDAKARAVARFVGEGHRPLSASPLPRATS